VIHSRLGPPADFHKWFRQPASTPACQSTLFPDSLSETLLELRVSADELRRWHSSGWVSFGPEDDLPLEQWHVNELRFVRDASRSGLPDAFISALFGQLPRPMNFDPESVLWSPGMGWVQWIPPGELDTLAVVDEHVYEWIDQLLVDHKTERLTELYERLGQIVAGIETPDVDE
jgi:hypothetical protein